MDALLLPSPPRPCIPSYSYNYICCLREPLRKGISGCLLLNKMNHVGVDSDGREFKNSDEMWREEVGDQSKKSEWYTKAVSYWQGVEATVDGVLGGYGHVNDADIKGSEAFLKTLLSERFPETSMSRHLVALDCGSGIGRVSRNLLIRYFNEVDLQEPVSHFLDAARENLAPENLMVSDSHKAVNFFCFPLQDFTPDAQRYDCIWIQWCIGHLADEDLVSFFKRAKAGLKPNGFFVLKENIARNGIRLPRPQQSGNILGILRNIPRFVLDKEDKSITRSDSYFKELFKQCGLHVWKMKDQSGFPDELFAVKMYALVTEMPKSATRSSVRQSRNRPGLIK